MHRWGAIAAIVVMSFSTDATALPREVPKTDSALDERSGVLSWHGAPFSGDVIERAGDMVLVRTPYVAGLRHGVAEAFHPNGQLKYMRLYWRGLREGVHRGFHPNGNPEFVSSYEHDLLDGEQRTYFEDGKLAELRHFRDGHEDGRQQMFDAQGNVIANYVFRGGRRYGIVGRMDCITRVGE